MHEEALLKALRRELTELARAEGADRISRVALRIGALSHVTEAALRARWSETVRGTPAESARLEVALSEDLGDPRAASIVLVSVDVSEGPAEAPAAPATTGG